MFFVKFKLKELALEFLIFNLLSLTYYFIVSGASIRIDDIGISAALWLATVFYRLISLQIPIAWYASKLFLQEKELTRAIYTGAVNCFTFVVMMLVVSIFSVVIDAFLELENLFITIITVASTTLSPLFFYGLKRMFATANSKQ